MSERYTFTIYYYLEHYLYTLTLAVYSSYSQAIMPISIFCVVTIKHYFADFRAIYYYHCADARTLYNIIKFLTLYFADGPDELPIEMSNIAKCHYYALLNYFKSKFHARSDNNYWHILSL